MQPANNGGVDHHEEAEDVPAVIDDGFSRFPADGGFSHPTSLTQPPKTAKFSGGSIRMPDPIPLTDHWVGNAITATVTAVIAVGGTIFSTRKRSEATLMAQVDTKMMGFADRLTAEIERLDEAMKSERVECERQLAELRRQIAELMLGEVAEYPPEVVNRALHPRGKS